RALDLKSRFRGHMEALANYDRALELDPNLAPVWNNKGYTLNDLGRHAEALAVCDQAIELAPKYAYSWKNRGRAMLGLRQTGEAMDNFRHAIKLNGNLSGAFESLAEAHTLRDDWAAAEQVLSERFRLPPSPFNPAKSWHLPDLIATIFRAR